MDNLFQFVDREVGIVTAAGGQRRGGLVATWVQPTSLDPAEPIVAVSICVNHFTRELIDAAGTFALHLLAEDQSDLALNFCCDSGRDRDKLASIAWQLGDLGNPVLTDCAAASECRVVDRYEAAGRVFYFADVVRAHVIRNARPLREQALLAAADPEQRTALRIERETNVEAMRTAIQTWRNDRSPNT